MEALKKIQQLKAELDGLRPLNAEAEARIMQKFRLDWNYHSNNIEGNSLTYGETKAFILFGITAGKKPFKDYLEIKGHNEAINWVLSLVKGETELTEVFIRELHTLLLKESSDSFAQTPDGKPTTKKIEVGKYKTLPNHVLTATGEMFYFASPEETPAKMQELIDWFRAEREKSDVNPIILATLFHYRFIRIHPFDDGNGRTARILMNFILMQNGFPPAIIKTEDKENYYGVLRLADVGELEPFIEYIANNLIHSLEMMIKGAKGEDIEEPDDLDKELALLERRIKSISPTKEIRKSEKTLLNLNYNSINPLFLEFKKSCEKFSRFYRNTDFYIQIDEAIYYIREDSISLNRNELLKTRRIIVVCTFDKFKESGFGDFNFESRFTFRFEPRNYSVRNSNDEIIYQKKYSENLNNLEIKQIVSNETQRHKKFIEEKLSQNS